LLDISHIKRINGVPKIPAAKIASAVTKGTTRHGDAAVAYLTGYLAATKPLPSYDYEGSRAHSTAASPFGASASTKRGLL
jgi:phage FluMu gp28-like protein